MSNPVGTPFMYGETLHVFIVDYSYNQSASVWRLDPAPEKLAEIALTTDMTISNAVNKDAGYVSFAIGSSGDKLAINGDKLYARNMWGEYFFHMTKGEVRYMTDSDRDKFSCIRQTDAKKQTISVTKNSDGISIRNNIDASAYNIPCEYEMSPVYCS